MNKVPYGFIHKQSWPRESVLSISVSSRKCLSNGKIPLQKMPPESQQPFYNNSLIIILEDKVVLEGGGHVRDLTSLIPQIGRII
jgi:hypothetical protein